MPAARRRTGRRPSLALGRGGPALPGTAAEAEAPSRRRCKAFAAAEPLVLTGGSRRRRPSFKAAQAPRVVVLSTHGFFLPTSRST